MPLPALLICLIVGVTDGDTLTARCDQQTVKIRLAEIDAPEKAQPLQRGHLGEAKYLSFVGRQGGNHEAN